MRNCSVICYHRILPDVSNNLGTIEAYQYQRSILHSLEDFRKQLDLLQEKCTIVDAKTFLECRNGKKMSKPAVLLSFDDGYEDFSIIVVPELNLRRLPCILFPTKAPVVSGFIPPADQVYAILAADYRGQRRLTDVERKSWVGGEAKKKMLSCSPDDQIQLIKDLSDFVGISQPSEAPRHMNEEQIKQLPETVYLGAHGLYHHEFGSLTTSALNNELHEIIEWVEMLRPHQRNGVWLAYPNGKADRDGKPNEVTNAVRLAGVDFAFTASFELSNTDGSNLAIPRIFSKNGVDWLNCIWQ
jgi:peptidoglycan/xylan/chitin deacetylase (PgdA/CDA1 family)